MLIVLNKNMTTKEPTKEKDIAVSHNHSRTTENKNQVHRIDTTIYFTMERWEMGKYFRRGRRKRSSMMQCQNKSLGRQHAQIKQRSTHVQWFKYCLRVQKQNAIRSRCSRNKKSRNSLIKNKTRHFHNQKWKRGLFGFNI